MPLWSLQAGDLVLDFDRMSKTVEKRAYGKMREAARLFLREAFLHIPVWTGEAISSLFPLAQYLHVKLPAGKTTPHKEAKENRFSIGMSQGEIQNPFIVKDGWQFSFEVISGVDHFNINEFNDVSQWGIHLRHETPWKAFSRGAEVAVDFLNQTGHTIVPNFADFVVIKNVVDYA